ncbi:MAG TPA: DNA polymerase III subunit alpha [Bacillota bacterium]|jgi:error-prone DNA polymerase
MTFSHLHVHSQFSFLDGAGRIEDLVSKSADDGSPAIAVTDHSNLSVAVPLAKAAKAAGIKAIQGVELWVATPLASEPEKSAGDASAGVAGGHLTLLAQNPRGYANICRLVSRAHLENPRLDPRVWPAALRVNSEEVIALSGCRRGEIPSLILRGRHQEALEVAGRYRDLFGPDRFFIELQDELLPGTTALVKDLKELADRLGLRVVATNNVHYLTKAGFPTHDLLTCVRTLTTIGEVHPERRLNAENYLKSPTEMVALFRAHPEAVRTTEEIAERCQPALDLGANLFPKFTVPLGETAGSFLRKVASQGAVWRYRTITPDIRGRLDHELDIITKLGYEDYFLLVWDVAKYARGQGIRFAGRGSAADSAVAYCLGITDVDAIRRGLLFERFMSLERAEKPDIDIDFDARHRDRVTRYIYERYGADRVATVATFNTFQGRSAIRDLGKVLDFPPEELDRLAKRLPWIGADELKLAFEGLPELRQGGLLPVRRYQKLFEAAAEVAGFPRHLGTHLGGVVISACPLNEVTALQEAAKGVVVCQMDKTQVEDAGLVKLDLLCLRTMGAVEESVRAIQTAARGTPPAASATPPGPPAGAFDYDQIPMDDPEVYKLLQTGKTIGVFQLESPAQRALQARLGTEDIEDIVASVALIRPGPIKGNMVEPFIARRRGREPVTYLHPALEPILERTYGVVLFQEQVIEIATAVAGFTPGEADRLRRVMSHARSRKDMEEIGRLFVEKARAKGVEGEVAETVFGYMAGYASYGFCEAHAAAFASTAYKTAYLLRYHPAEFFAGILTLQPMGYYPPNTICVEARRRGVAILQPDVNKSGEAFQVETINGRETAEGDPPKQGIRIALKRVKGMSSQALGSIIKGRGERPFADLFDFCARTTVDRDIIENLIKVGAFDSREPNRRALLWSLDDALARGSVGGLLEVAEPAPPSPAIDDFTEFEKIAFEHQLLEIQVRRHYMSLLRERLRAAGFCASRSLAAMSRGRPVKIAGLLVRPHRPPTKSGRTVVFLSLEDEFGLADVTVFESVYQKYGQYIFCDPCPPLIVWGQIERRGKGVSVTAERLAHLDPKDLPRDPTAPRWRAKSLREYQP